MMSAPEYPCDSPRKNYFEPADRDSEEPGAGSCYVIHLYTTVTEEDAALDLACRIADGLNFLPELDRGLTTFSSGDDQVRQRRVFCDLKLANGTRCVLRRGHVAPCTGAVSEQP